MSSDGCEKGDCTSQNPEKAKRRRRSFRDMKWMNSAMVEALFWQFLKKLRSRVYRDLIESWSNIEDLNQLPGLFDKAAEWTKWMSEERQRCGVTVEDGYQFPQDVDFFTAGVRVTDYVNQWLAKYPTLDYPFIRERACVDLASSAAQSSTMPASQKGSAGEGTTPAKKKKKVSHKERLECLRPGEFPIFHFEGCWHPAFPVDQTWIQEGSKEGKERLRDEFEKAVEKYFGQVEQYLMQHPTNPFIPVRPVHIRWLVRRMVEVETACAIAGNPGSASFKGTEGATNEDEVRRKTKMLAEFIGLKIPVLRHRKAKPRK